MSPTFIWLVRAGAVALALTIVSAIIILVFPDPPRQVEIATAFKGVSFEYYGQRYKQSLERNGIKVVVRETAGSVENLELLSNPSSGVAIALVQGGVSDGSKVPEVVSLGMIYNTAFWIFYKSEKPVERLSQLKGMRIALGPAGSGTRISGEKVLAAGGVNGTNTFFAPLGGRAAVQALKAGTVDVVWLISTSEAEAVQELLRMPGIRLMNFRTAEAYTRVYPDLVRLVIPEGALDLDANLPEHDINLIGKTNRLLVRKDLHPAIANILLQTIRQEHSGASLLQKSGEFPIGSDPEYPMAESAIDYYKNGPSFLQRNLPLWLHVHATRAIAIIATVVPLVIFVMSFEPTLYRWIIRARLRPFYRRLRAVDRDLLKATSIEQLSPLRATIEELDQKCLSLKIPLRYGDAFFSLKTHLNLVRTRLLNRATDLRA